MKHYYYLLCTLSLTTVLWQPLNGYKFCNEGKNPINVLVFANEKDIADFLNKYNFSEEQGDTHRAVESSDLPSTGWIRISYSSKGSDIYLSENKAIKQVHELSPGKCFNKSAVFSSDSSSDDSETTSDGDETSKEKKDTKKLEKLSKAKEIVEQETILHFLVFEATPVIKKNREGRTQYHVQVLDRQSGNSDEELSYGY